MYSNSRRVGNVGEAVAMSEFVKRGIDVFIPFGQNTPVDMMVIVNDKILKIQVKTTSKIKHGRMEFDLCRTNGFTGKATPYTKEEVDYIFLYCIENEYKGIISFEKVDGKKELSLRVERPKNNQVAGINNACDYDFEKWISSYELR